jgi:predicted ester cyclase
MTPPDASARNKQNYLAAKAAFNARDLDACIAFYAPDHRISSQAGQPAPSIRRFFEQTIAAWPDIRIDVAHAVAEDDWVMGRSIAAATHVNRVMGVDATQKRIETVFWDLHRFNQDGLIVETWNLMDGVSMMQQLGLIPPPAR